jgi:hypothetical protein
MTLGDIMHDKCHEVIDCIAHYQRQNLGNLEEFHQLYPLNRLYRLITEMFYITMRSDDLVSPSNVIRKRARRHARMNMETGGVIPPERWQQVQRAYELRNLIANPSV